MNATDAYHIQKIKDDLSQRQRSNPQYSLRAYSRDMGINAATLCQILKGFRALPLKKSKIMMDRMGLGPKERTLFFDSLVKSRAKLDTIVIDKTAESFILDETHHKIIAEWEYFAVLELIELSDFKSDLKYISKKLGISLNRADVVISNLLKTNLMNIDVEGNFRKTHERIRTTEDIKDLALRNSHKESMKMGAEKIDSIEVELRDFSSMTVATDPEKLLEAKAIIREFRQKMAALLRDGSKKDVYHLAIQFYPLTEIEN